MRRTIWIIVAITSGLAQFLLVICGGILLSERFSPDGPSELIVLGAVWSLFWPVYAFVGIRQHYRTVEARAGDGSDARPEGRCIRSDQASS